MSQRVPPSFQARRALLRSLAPRYQQASPAQKKLLLDAFVEWTGYTRKYAIALLNHGAHDQQTIQRHRSPQYGQAVQQALFLTWKTAYYVCAKRLLPSLPTLVTSLEQHGHVCLTEEERRCRAGRPCTGSHPVPFPLLGIDTDSGSEFLNAEVIGHCEQDQLTFTRGRPGVKNDQCHVEQKNGAVVRKVVGCARLVGMQAYQHLREVYQVLRLVVNCFQPSLKLQAYLSQGDRMRRVYDVAQTPLQRLLASGVLSEVRQRDLRERIQQIDPLTLSERLDALRFALLCGADGPAEPQPGLSLALSTSVPMPASAGEPGRTGHQEAHLPEEVVSSAD